MLRSVLRVWPLALGAAVAGAGWMWPQHPEWRRPLPAVEGTLLGFSADARQVQVFHGESSLVEDPPWWRKPEQLVEWRVEDGAESRRADLADELAEPFRAGEAAWRRIAAAAFPERAAERFGRRLESQRRRELLWHLSEDRRTAAWRMEEPAGCFTAWAADVATGAILCQVPDPAADPPMNPPWRHPVLARLDGAGERLAAAWLEPGSAAFVEFAATRNPTRRTRVPLPRLAQPKSLHWAGAALHVEYDLVEDQSVRKRFLVRIDAASGQAGPPEPRGEMHFSLAFASILTEVPVRGTLSERHAGPYGLADATVRRSDPPALAARLAEKVPAFAPAVARLFPHATTHVALLDAAGLRERWRSPRIAARSDRRSASGWRFSPDGRWWAVHRDLADGSVVEVYATAGRWRWPWLLALPLGAWVWRRCRSRTRV